MLKAEELVFVTALGNSGSLGTLQNIYSFKSLSLSQRTDLERRLAAKRALLKANEMKEVGERYAYWLIYRSRLFQQGKYTMAGHFVDDLGGYAADIKCRYKVDRFHIGEIVVEVKNTREIYYPRSEIFEKLLKGAIAHSAQPVLVVGHLSQQARDMCAAIGIAVLELGRQLLPSAWKNDVEALTGIIGPQPFEYVTKRLYHAGASPQAQRDLDIVMDPMWLVGPATIWASKKHLVAANPLMSWRELQVLLQAPPANQLRIAA